MINTEDYHTLTYRKNKEFRKFMWKLYWFKWWFWSKSRKRYAAKTWNHATHFGYASDKRITTFMRNK